MARGVFLALEELRRSVQFIEQVRESMTDRDALLRAICDAPDDDAPRLIYADWLDEHGDPLQAEFIRVQIELARNPPRGRKYALGLREEELWRQRRTWRHQFGDWLDTALHNHGRGFDDQMLSRWANAQSRRDGPG
jgi:uncharacterized protein (TIGR02996 family)